MKMRHPVLIRLAAVAAAWLIRMWMSTIRYRILFHNGRRHPTNVRRQRHIYTFWHESILCAVRFQAPIYTLISQHADGELIAKICGNLGLGVVRGSSTRGGGPALMELVRCSRHAHLGVTPDGPRGPRRRVQPGVVFLAAITGLPIIGFGVGFDRAWRARSWDRFAIPLPFSTARFVLAPAIHVPAGLNRSEMEAYRLLVEEYMLQASQAAEHWAQTGRRPEPREWRKLDKAVRASA
jgi:lysophospholipid acyltransferase (LPLAT)-like uncharacterized protein